MSRFIPPFFQRYGIALCSGAALALAFPGYHLFYLAWIALAPVVWMSARAKTPADAAAQWFAAGWAFHTILLQWLMSNIYWAGGWAILAYQLLVLPLALYWALVGYAWAWGAAREPRTAALLFAALWAAMEWMQATLFSGFGWSALAYSQGPDLAFAQWAAVGGTGLIALALAYANAALGLAAARPEYRWLRLAGAAAVLIGAHLGGGLFLGDARSAEPPRRVGVFQPNFSNELKWDDEYTLDMVTRAAYHSSTLEEYKQLDLMVWPEATLMAHFEIPEVLGPLSDYTKSKETALLAGSVRYDGSGSYNSAVLIGKDGAIVDHYDKVKLVPFGEYIPFKQVLGFLEQIVPSNADSGGEQKLLETDGMKIGPLICFEVLYAPMSEALRERGAQVLAVGTNLSWFGVSSAIPQELEIARFRAIETRLPLIHAANTGISGLFDPYGRFKPADMSIGQRGRLIEWTRLESPRQIMRQRVVGAFDLPAPGTRPVPWGPPLAPYFIWALAFGLFAWAAYAPRRRKAAVPGETGAPAAAGAAAVPPFDLPPKDDFSI